MNISDKVRKSLETMGCIVPEEGDFEGRDSIHIGIGGTVRICAS